VKIKVGQLFKFIVDGNKYLHSTRYFTVKDEFGNINNSYEPEKVKISARRKLLMMAPNAIVTQDNPR
jgi:hypothetical protein